MMALPKRPTRPPDPSAEGFGPQAEASGVRAGADRSTDAGRSPIASRNDALRRMRDAGYRIAAVLPIHYPRALLRACGFHPVEVWGPARVDSRGGDLRFQAYTCAIVRNAVALLSEGKLDPADALLVPHTCDALQGMGSVLGDFVKPHQRVLTLYHPRRGGPAAVSFLVDELRRLQQELSAHGGRQPTDADWKEALGVEAEADAALALCTGIGCACRSRTVNSTRWCARASTCHPTSSRRWRAPSRAANARKRPASR